jgi:Zn-dependent M16 (insulinase) family peptidase
VLTVPTQVSYVGKGANLFDLGYQVDGSILVIAPYLQKTWLWENVRAQGGAYGVFSLFDRHTGVFTFLSYRDPNLLSTLQAYDGAGGFLRDLDLSQSELTKAIITAIGDMDTYRLPDAQGYTSMLRYLTGVSDEERQQLRDEVLSTTVEDFRAFGDVLEGVKTQGRIVVLGSAGAVQAAGADGMNFEIVQVI